MYFALFYETVENYTEKRKPYRAEHLELANQAHADGLLVMAGAFSEPADGALLVFKAGHREAVEDFVKKDPYVKNGLVRKWQIRPWTVVIGMEK